MTPQEAETATPDEIRAANIETGKAMIAGGQSPADVAAWLYNQVPGFKSEAEAGAALTG